MHRYLLVAGMVVLSACHEDRIVEPLPQVVRLSPSDPFAGAEVFLTGDRYRDGAKSFTVLAGSTVLVVRRVDDSTIAARLPSDVNGAFPIRERVNNQDVDRGSVTAHGYVRTGTITSNLEAVLTPSTGTGSPYITTGDTAGLTILYPGTDQAVRFPGFTSMSDANVSGRGAGITYLADRVLFPPLPGGPIGHVAYFLQPDTLRDGAVPIGGGHLVSEISHHVYLVSGSNTLDVWVWDSAGASFSFPSTTFWLSASRHYLSPAGNRAAANGSSLPAPDDSGAVVLDAATGLLAYRVPSIKSVSDVVFSADGGTLYLASFGSVVAVNALTGDSLAGLSSITQGGFVRALAFDPVASLLYVMSTDTVTTANDTRVEIRVVDPVTLGVNAVIVSPSDAQCGYCALARNSVLQVDRTTSQLTVLLAFADHATILHFSLPPAP